MMLVLPMAIAVAEPAGTSRPTFTDQEIALINKDPRLVTAFNDNPRMLRQLIDSLKEGDVVEGEDAPDGRASAEAAHDLLQILKQVR
jgi:hypothetical protein